MRDFSDDLKALRVRLDEAHGYLRIDDGRLRLVELEHEIGRPDLWDDQERAKKLNGEYSNVKGDVDQFDVMTSELDDLDVLHEMAREMDDESQEPDLQAGIDGLTRSLGELELRSLFTGPHDECDAIVHINAKDGGVDAQDWSEMLLRMYQRWSERRGFEFEVDGYSEGTEAGIMSAEFTLKGRYAYGMMVAERGTHRLVRISPFDNQGRRQTSFAAVQVWPVLENPDIEINEADIRMEVFRASGAGGQHINKTSSAVRLIMNRRAWSRPRRRSAASSRTVRRRCRASRRWSPPRSKKNERPRWLGSPGARPRWAGEARSAATCSSRTKW